MGSIYQYVIGLIYRYIWSVARWSPANLFFCLIFPLIIWGGGLQVGGGQLTPEGEVALLHVVKSAVVAAILSVIATVLVYHRPTNRKMVFAFVLSIIAGGTVSIGYFSAFFDLVDVSSIQTVPTVSDLLSKD